MDDATTQRWYAIMAYLGLGLVIAGFIGNAFARVLLALAFVGLLLVAVGGFGLIGLSNRARRRPVQPLPPPPPVGASPGAPPPAGAGTPIPTSWDLSRPVRFDLTAEYREYESQMRTAILMRAGFGVILVVFAAYFAGASLLRGDPTGVALAVMFLALAGFLFWVLRSVQRAPIEMEVGPDGIRFQLRPAGTVKLRWDDPQFGVRLTIVSAAANHSIDPRRSTATYRLFTGSGSGVGHGPRVLTAIPRPAIERILRQADARGLYPLERTLGLPGTVSERTELRLIAGARPFTAGVPYTLPPP